MSAVVYIPWKFIIQGKTVDVEVEGPLILDDPELALSPALDGLGIAYIAKAGRSSRPDAMRYVRKGIIRLGRRVYSRIW
jgi:hypothetical protein